MKRIAFYGGSFDPIHRGHLAIALAVLERFALDEFIFVPAFHAPHKIRKRPTSAYDRYAMLSLVVNDDAKLSVSRLEIEVPERPFTFETLSTLKTKFPDTQIFFVMGADSWMDITTWRHWEEVLTMSDHIVMTRPGVEMETRHVTDAIRQRIVDLRGAVSFESHSPKTQIYITDLINLDMSSTAIRQKIREGDLSWKGDVPIEVAKYVEKYQIYS